MYPVTTMTTNKSLIFLACFVFVMAIVSVDRQWSSSLDLLLYDHHIRAMAEEPADDVVIVAIDDASLQAIGEWPWSRAFHAEAIDLLYAGGAKALAYNLVFTHAREDDVAGDLSLKDVLQRHPVVLPVYLTGVNSGDNVSYSEVLPHPMFAASAVLGHVNMSLDKDAVARTVNLQQGLANKKWPHFSQQLLRLSGLYNFAPTPFYTAPKIVSSENLSHQQLRYIPYAGEADGFKQVSFIQLLTGRVPANFFQDKVVLVGVTANSLGDPLTTPLTSAGQTMSAVEVNANIFQGLRSNRMINPMPSLLVMLVVVVILLALVWLIPRLSSFLQLLVSLLFVVFSYGVSCILLKKFSVWLPIGSLLTGIVLIAPLWNVLRFNRVLNYFLRESSIIQKVGDKGLFTAGAQGTAKEFEKNLLEFITLFDLKNICLQCNGQKIFGACEDSSDQQIEFSKNFTVKISEFHYSLDVGWYCVGEGEQKILKLITQIFNRFAQGHNEKSNSHDILIEKMNFFKRLQQESAKTQMLFQSAIDEMAGGLLVADEMGGLLFHNQQAAQMLDISPQERSIFACLTSLHIKNPSVDWRSHARQVLISGQSNQLEASTVKYSDLDVVINTMHAPQSQQTLLMVNISNIEKIKTAQRLRNETIDFLSHDMRSPMVSLLALTQQQINKESDDNSKQFLRQVQAYAQTNLDYAEQFLQLAKVESEEPIEKYPLDFGALVQGAIDSVYHQGRGRGVNIVFNEPDDVWVHANGDVLERVLVNLLTNAIKYGQADSLVNVKIEEQAESLTLSVENSGPAIDVSVQQNLFKPYQRAVKGEQKKQPGVGLGLRFVYVSLQRHDSLIELHSDEQSTCFFFELQKISIT